MKAMLKDSGRYLLYEVSAANEAEAMLAADAKAREMLDMICAKEYKTVVIAVYPSPDGAGKYDVLVKHSKAIVTGDEPKRVGFEKEARQ